MRRKIVAIAIMVLFLAIPLNIAEASNITNKQENEPLVIEVYAIDPDGFVTTEEIIFYEEEFEEFKNAISKIMDEIESANDFNWNSIRDSIVNLLGEGNKLKDFILDIFSLLKLSRNRGFVISEGHGLDLNPLDKKIDIKFRKKIAFWHYNSQGMFTDRTIIVKPFALNMKILKGRQIGLMSKFIGVYFSVSKGFLKDTFTFFYGTASHINGLQFYLQPQ